jgi:hypothetical protein
MAAMIAHSIHNTSLVLVDNNPAVLCLTIFSDWGGVALVFVIMIVAIRRERSWIVTQLADEVENGTLSEMQYAIAMSAWGRFLVLLEALFSGGPAAWWKVNRYLDALTELAYRKHAFKRRGEAGASPEAIVRNRLRASALSEELSHIRA